ncbi:putative S-layer protein [Candidatus Desulfosporosinus infrequens]|uniref:Putative S-layer protein n=1 Tax=Candidatus Desulfosporosinus infrequens TaxID=2043169 RepID=A0A2U3LN50_9FIRM|nr:putative S-layer protein [Candidatus Desulfosporosinus infrequens]
MFNKGLAILPVILTVTLLASPVITLAGVAVSSSVTVTVPAVVSSGGNFSLGDLNSAQQSQPAISLDKATNTVKQAFTIPAQLTNFGSGLSKYMNHQVWDLHWMNPQNPPSGIDAQVDATTGELISMRIEQFLDSQAPELQIPILTEDDAKKIATDLLTRLDSDKIQELQLQKESDKALNPNNYAIPLYSFHWQRTINNIPFLGDGVTVQVNGNTGQVMFYNQNWTAGTSELPDAQKAISVEKAQGIFQNNDMLQLQYYQAPTYLPYGNVQDKPQVKLVYAPNSKYLNGAIDALSGEPVQLSESSFNNSQGMMGWGPMYSSRGPGYLGGLSSQEQSAVDNTNLISQDAALKIATQWVDIPKGAVFQNASLNTGGMEPDQKVWSLSWGPDPEKINQGQMLFINAMVDAVTGDLLSFNNTVPPGEYGQEGQITREQALQIAQEFLQKIQPQYYPKVKLRDEDPSVKSPSQNGMENFYFYRTSNNIPFMNNGFNISVDTVGKSILNYNFNWSDIDLPAQDGVLKADQANVAYLKSSPLVLNYVQLYSDNKPDEVELVYLPKPDVGLPLGADLLDAKSGVLLGWDGQDVSGLPKSYQFKDISGNFAEKEITLLGQTGIFGEYGDQFKPDENISTISLLRAMMTVQNGVWTTYLQSDQDILKASQNLGWVSKDAQPSDPVNRVTLAQLMIHLIKLDNVAQLKDAFQDTYSDSTSFPPGMEGYITFGRALDLFHFDGDQFKPEQPVARAEVAYALVQALSFKRQGTKISGQ